MGYRRQKIYSRYNNKYAMSGGYDSTGRWRSEAWHMDGGANDEGWHQAYCNRCGKVTEHGRGSGCVPCGDRIVASRVRRKKKANPANSDWKLERQIDLDRAAVLRIYKVNAGSLPNFLESLNEQLSNNWKARYDKTVRARKLTAKQIEVGAKVLKNIVDQDIIDRLWTRTSPRNADAELKIGSIVRMESTCDPRIVTGKNCPWSRYDNEFEIKSLLSPDMGSTWTSDVKSYVVIK